MDLAAAKPGLGIFKPRAVAVGAAAAAEHNPACSNAEFRKMLLAKGKGQGTPAGAQQDAAGKQPGGSNGGKDAPGASKPAPGDSKAAPGAATG